MTHIPDNVEGFPDGFYSNLLKINNINNLIMKNFCGIRCQIVNNQPNVEEFSAERGAKVEFFSVRLARNMWSLFMFADGAERIPVKGFTIFRAGNVERFYVLI
ncbi:hypothetical protein ABEH87_20065 [Erwinia sp. Eh17-17]|jgi:hypothetical protein|uniref:hypothetical protein n=1 Tax=Erwinia sp. Eh17-17 TaxID=3080330 RepID=UPI0032090020